MIKKHNKISLEGAKLFDSDQKVVRYPFTKTHYHAKETNASLYKFGQSLADCTEVLCDSLGGMMNIHEGGSENKIKEMKVLVGKMNEKMEKFDTKAEKVDVLECRLDGIDDNMKSVVDHNTEMQMTLDAVNYQLSQMLALLSKK